MELLDLDPDVEGAKIVMTSGLMDPTKEEISENMRESGIGLHHTWMETMELTRKALFTEREESDLHGTT